MVADVAGLGSVSPSLPEELRAAYEDERVFLRELLARLWRWGDADGRLTDRLAAPAVFRCLEISRENGKAAESVRGALRDACFKSWPDNLGAFLALSAVARSLPLSLRNPDLAEAPLEVRYVAELVRSATLDLAWDDSTGPIILSPRATTLAKALIFRVDLAELARRVVIEVPPPHLPNHETFVSYVRAAVTRLKNGEVDSGRNDHHSCHEKRCAEQGNRDGGL